MDVMREPGRALSRDIARGEAVEHELDAFISKRHESRVKDEGERAVEDAWRESYRRQDARRRRENRAGWWGWHMDRAGLYARLSAEHEAAAEGLLGEGAA